jgi:RNA polymerase sigma-70 factor, ECF subfamily
MDTRRYLRQDGACHKYQNLNVISIVDATNAQTAVNSIDALDVESAFGAHYRRLARTIALVIGNRGRAEELAVDVFLKWTQKGASGPDPEGWLYRAAANLAIDELRKQTRRARFDRLFQWMREPATPEEIHSANQERDHVRVVLATMQRRQAELLVLRTQGFSYEELASTLRLNRASIGTLLKRAEQTFRKEYIAKYGPQ